MLEPPEISQPLCSFFPNTIGFVLPCSFTKGLYPVATLELFFLQVDYFLFNPVKQEPLDPKDILEPGHTVVLQVGNWF